MSTAEFQITIDRALRAYYPENINSLPHYDSVSVLLLLWDNDHKDLRCRNEVERLSDIFRLSYGYSTKISEIPAQGNPERWLYGCFEEFSKDKTARDLLIVYYAGHGMYDKSGSPCIWL